MGILWLDGVWKADGSTAATRSPPAPPFIAACAVKTALGNAPLYYLFLLHSSQARKSDSLSSPGWMDRWKHVEESANYVRGMKMYEQLPIF